MAFTRRSAAPFLTHLSDPPRCRPSGGGSTGFSQQWGSEASMAAQIRQTVHGDQWCPRHVQFRGFRVSPNQPGPGPNKPSNGRGRHEATPTSVSWRGGTLAVSRARASRSRRPLPPATVYHADPESLAQITNARLHILYYLEPNAPNCRQHRAHTPLTTSI